MVKENQPYVCLDATCENRASVEACKKEGCTGFLDDSPESLTTFASSAGGVAGCCYGIPCVTCNTYHASHKNGYSTLNLDAWSVIEDRPSLASA